MDPYVKKAVYRLLYMAIITVISIVIGIWLGSRI